MEFLLSYTDRVLLSVAVTATSLLSMFLCFYYVYLKQGSIKVWKPEESTAFFRVPLEEGTSSDPNHDVEMEEKLLKIEQPLLQCMGIVAVPSLEYCKLLTPHRYHLLSKKHKLIPKIVDSHHNNNNNNNTLLFHDLINQLQPKPKIRPLSEIVVDYTPDNIEVKYTKSLEITILFNMPHGGSRWRTIMKSGHGLYTAKIRTPAGNASGLVSSFYLSTGQEDNDPEEQQQDEIDFEFLGFDAQLMQTNVHVKGIGNREMVHDLGFDASAVFHEYSIFWSSESIEWYVDGICVRVMSRKKKLVEEEEFDPEWPIRPMYLYASVWNAESIADGRWAGQYVGCDEPYACAYKDVFIPAA